MKERLPWAAALLLAGVVAWLPMVSVGMCLALQTLDRTPPDILPYAALLYWKEFGTEPLVQHWFPLCLGVATVITVTPAMALICWPRSRAIRVARPGQTPPAPQRSLSDLHGSADWLSMENAKRLFPGPHREYGGVVVGEAYRPDQDRTAKGPFDPAEPASWGQGGKAPLLIDPCTADATHGAVFAGSGGYKTTAVTIPTLACWTGSAVVLDPSCQVGPMTAAMRRDMDHKVVMLGPGLQGFNALDWIDPTDWMAETHIQAVIERIAGDGASEPAGENAMFKVRGKELLTCLLADLVFDTSLPVARKTLREFRDRVRTPEKKMRGRLADIHAESKSPLARDLAGTLMDVVSETFSGIYSNAVADTQWLSIKAYADMLSGNAFQSSELTEGSLTVFINVDQEVLRATPQIARVIVGSLLSAAYRAKGDVRGRILFLLDEVNFLGRLRALEDARDAGRKYGITLVPMWQSLGQLLQTWGKEAKDAWFNSLSWRMFAVIDEDSTAEEVSKTAGRYTVVVRTQGKSSGSQSGGPSSSSSYGQNEGVSEQGRALIQAAEVRTRLRADEAIIFRRGAAPLRCGRAIYFRRPELLARVEADRYRTAAE